MKTTKNTGIGKLIGGVIVTGMGLWSLVPGSGIGAFTYELNGVKQEAISQMGSHIVTGGLILVGVALLASYFLKKRKACLAD